MDIALYQILVPGFSLMMLAKVSSHFLRQERTLRELMTNILFWGGLAYVAIFPQVTDVIARVLGIKSNVNALVFSLLGILSYLVLHLLVQQERLEQEITRLTRQLALRDYGQKPRTQKKAP